MKLSHTIYTVLVFLALTALSTNITIASGSHHNDSITNNYYASETVINKSISDSKADKSTAKSTAAGQHNFKSTTDLQWSIGAGFAGDESALSLGLGLQTGNIFFSGNVTGALFSGESDPIFGFGASGTF